jgi:hypothetical protein
MSILVVAAISIIACFSAFYATRLFVPVPTGEFAERHDFLVFFVFLPAFPIIWGIRNSRRTPGCDIQCVETLTWSWKAGAMVCGPILILGLVFGLGTGFTRGRPIADAIVGVVFAALLGLPLGAFFGQRTGVQEMKTVPNQGIRLSMRCAIYGGLVVGLTLALILSLVSFLSLEGQKNSPHPAPDALRAGLDGLVFGLALAFIVGSGWYGGLDFILHYTLRLLLSMKGRAPLNLVRFLDYAAKDLNFLQKVGGGYIFIHRMLLEHFANWQNEGKSNPQETPALA